MSIEVRDFAKTADGRAVCLYRMTNRSGAYVEVLDYGCTLHKICVPNRDGALVDVCLGYDTMAEYEAMDGYLGAFIGRHANRIGKGRFELNGREYSLAVNNGPNHLHGGMIGFDKAVWNCAVASDRLIFTRTSPDGEEGYPGTLNCTVCYAFSEDGALSLTYDATCDADTVINLTNHCYFNLSGHDSGYVGDQTLRVDADEFTENDSDCLPTGKVFSVEGTPFDFRVEKTIGRDIEADDINLKNGSGYDHNFILRGEGLREVAKMHSEKTGITMTVETTQPGIQVYSANFLTERNGKGGCTYQPRHALCLETQHFPDAVHHANFPSAILKKGEAYHQVTVYRFSVDGE